MNCQALRNVPKGKLNRLLDKIDSEISEPHKSALKKAYVRYFEANIPVMYWKLDMIKDFQGDENLKIIYNNIIEDLEGYYSNNNIKCFCGNFGRGKTLTCTNIIKRVVEKGYGGLYTTLNDIISAILTDEAFIARKELMMVDFLVIDEFDSRHMGTTDTASDFFGRTLEDVLRSRIQNNLPLFLCTNSPNPLDTFKGSIKESINSLWNHVEMIPVLGKDFRNLR